MTTLIVDQDAVARVTRKDRAAWLRGEIRRRHSDLWRLIPSLADAPDARLAACWEDATHACMQLWALSAELEGNESK